MSYPDTLHLGCGEDYREGEHNVDAVAAVGPDEVADLNECPWPWPDATFRCIRAYHVLEHLADVETALRECARVLEPGGRLITRWPVGVDALADPDHKHRWTWRTPTFYCGKRHWDRDVGLRVIHRDVSLWPAGPEGPLQAYDRLRWALRKRLVGAGPWCFTQQGSSGEFEVIFEKPRQETPSQR